jgi:membrane-associated protein
MIVDIWHAITNFDAQLPMLVAIHAHSVYFILFMVVFLQVGVLPFFFLPSNPFLFVCGAVWAASQLNIYFLLTTFISAAILGSLTAYWLGLTVGQVFFTRYLKWPDQASLDRTHAFYEQHGEKGFVFSLFLPVIRTIAPFLAGVTEMHLTKFVRSVVLGALFWTHICVLAGYFFGNIPLIKQHLGLVTLMGLALVLIGFVSKKIWDIVAK